MLQVTYSINLSQYLIGIACFTIRLISTYCAVTQLLTSFLDWFKIGICSMSVLPLQHDLKQFFTGGNDFRQLLLCDGLIVNPAGSAYRTACPL